ncbi:MAG TPA: glycosyl transferase, partial [Clostridiales bacterium]|nr:glycosyl transferase [Clostridiales bacterium]
TTVAWQWYHPDQLESLRLDCIKKDKWREINGYLVKGPFEKDPTSVVVEQTSYDEKTQEFTLKIRGIGGKVYYDIGSDPTSASKEVMDQVLVTAEPAIRFVCIDPTGERKTGEVVEFTGSVPIKYGQRNTPNGDVMTLVTNPKYVVKYTTDGSEPKENGGIYNDEFVLPQDSKYVRVAVYYKDRLLEEKSIYVTKGGGAKPAKTIDKSKALAYRYHNKKQMGDTEASYKELALLSKLDGVLIKGATAEIYNKTNTDHYIEFNASVPYWAGDLQSLIDLVRDTSFKETEVIVDFGYKELMFLTGDLFTQWLDMNKFDLNNLVKNGEIIQ